MKIKPEDIHKLQELQNARTSLQWAMASYDGGGLRFDEPDNDERRMSTYLPRDMGLEVLGMLYGLVTAKLKAMGVHFPEIDNRECFDCGGDGTAPKVQR